jgi:bifunctional DNA-binding transcriptional regulator/antitoxin component of YhaV-PrlF toxin-antitoxin module
MKRGVEDLRAGSREMRKQHLVVVPHDSYPAPPRSGQTRGFRRYKVSSVGQITLPAVARQSWGIEHGGTVEVANLGFAVIVVPERGAAALLDQWLSPELEDELSAESKSLLAASLGRSSEARRGNG